ncbi:MAG: aminotransferase class I/II-fold pyridoxal phosphate-dependent enzyme, partial [bacterium]|nr:aminotransferase class I/II-fold pyridoxal phosphate-dependent enzyme [bacterium]
ELENTFLGDNDTRGSLRLRQEICKSYETLELDHVMVTNGSSEALFTFFNELLDEGDEVVIPFPAFQCLYEVPVGIGCRMKYLDLMKCDGMRLDIGKLAEMVTPATKLIIINNPHNPIGWTLTAEELKQIGEIARENDAYLMFDEHYRYLPLTEGTDLIPSGYDVCRPFHAKTFASGSMIKCFGIVGIRIGWLLGDDPGMMARCRDYKDYITHTIPEITDSIAYFSLKNKETVTRRKKQDILPNLRLLNAFMEKNREVFDYVEPTGGVVCFPRLKGPGGRGIDTGTFCKELMQEHGVSLLPGFCFEIPGHFRINYGVDSAIFQKALEIMQNYVEKINC